MGKIITLDDPIEVLDIGDLDTLEVIKKYKLETIRDILTLDPLAVEFALNGEEEFKGFDNMSVYYKLKTLGFVFLCELPHSQQKYFESINSNVFSFSEEFDFITFLFEKENQILLNDLENHFDVAFDESLIMKLSDFEVELVRAQNRIKIDPRDRFFKKDYYDLLKEKNSLLKEVNKKFKSDEEIDKNLFVSDTKMYNEFEEKLLEESIIYDEEIFREEPKKTRK